MITAKVVADSKNEFGNRITTMVVTFPRIILAEFNTHRMFSRNSASSRAIPFEKMLKSVQENPFIPIAWQKDHKGMQGSQYFPSDGFTAEEGIGGEYLKQQWLNARDQAITYAEVFSKNNVTKQICNRLLEPFMWHTVIVTATEFENFFHLRCPQYVTASGAIHRSRKQFLDRCSDEERNILRTETDWLLLNKGQAEIHAMALAEAMYDAYQESAPKDLKAGEWHIPFGNGIYLEGEMTSEEFSMQCVKIATARCARVSYTVVGEEGIKKGDKVSFKGKHVFTVTSYNDGATTVEENEGVYPSEYIAKIPNYEADIKLHDRLAASGHWSPMEHCARAMNLAEYNNKVSLSDGTEPSPLFANEGMSGNLCGFVQYRKLFRNENVTK